MKAVYKNRLLKLAKLLEADARNKKGIKFHMGEWGILDNPNEPLSCGTSACAMGLAALSGAFKRAGLGSELTQPNWRLDYSLRFTWKDCYITGANAAEQLFGLTQLQSRLIFGGVENQTSQRRGAHAERIKAKQIRHFVKTGAIINPETRKAVSPLLGQW